MKTLIITLVLVFSSVGVLAQPELKGNPADLRQFLYPEDRTVTIYADAEEKAYSDQAIVSLVITTENRQFSEAIAENGVLRARLTKQLQEGGISRDAIQSSRFSSSPQYGWFGSKPLSYKVINRMAVTIDKENELEHVAKLADSQEAVEFADTRFQHTKKEEYEQKALSEAFDKVMQKKVFYEKTLGIKLTPIGIINSDAVGQASPGAVALDRVVVSSGETDRDGFSSLTKYGVDKSPRAPSFDEVVYRASVSVEFKLVP